MSDRADLYIPFFEKSLGLLETGGQLCFICTDRWTKNQYGRRLRALVSDGYSFDLYTDLYGEDAFQAKVLTYPAITLISRRPHDVTWIYHEPDLTAETARSIRIAISTKKPPHIPNLQIRRDVVSGEHPWLFGSVDQIELVKRFEQSFPTLEEAGCNVYIGAATGNNEVFIVDQTVDIEASRKLPVISASEIRDGELLPEGNFIINTYDDDGVVDLSVFPKLERYLNKHKAALQKRHVAKNSPARWYKTIDRIHPSRARKPKLLIPDIKSKLTIVFDPGKYHPNNSIYYICSDSWDLHALKAVLTAGIGNLFVQTYTTKVAGGNMRFQAQHLRRIRVPQWTSMSRTTQLALAQAGRTNDRVTALVLGSATDLKAAIEENAFGLDADIFTGYLILVEKSSESMATPMVRMNYFQVMPGFLLNEADRETKYVKNATGKYAQLPGISYLDRYDVMCKRLMLKGLYTGASVVAVPNEDHHLGRYEAVSPETSIITFLTKLQGHCQTAAAIARQHSANQA